MYQPLHLATPYGRHCLIDCKECSGRLCDSPVEEVRDMATVVGNDPPRTEGWQPPSEPASRPPEKSDNGDEAADQKKPISRRPRPLCNKRRRASSRNYPYPSVVLAGSMALLLAYVLQATLQRYRVAMKELQASQGSQSGTLDELSQPSAGTPPGTGCDEDASGLTCMDRGETHEKSDKEKSVSVSEVQILSTEGDKELNVLDSEVLQRGASSNITLVTVLRHMINIILSGVKGILLVFLQLYRLSNYVLRAVRSALSAVTTLGNTVLTSFSVLLTATTVSVIVLALYLLILSVSVTLPAGRVRDSIENTLGEALSVVSVFLHWSPHFAVLFPLLMLVVYRVVLNVPVPALLGRAVGMALAYLAHGVLTGQFSTSPDAAERMWDVYSSSLYYLAALGTFFSVDILRWLRIRPLLVGLLTLYATWLYISQIGLTLPYTQNS